MKIFCIGRNYAAHAAELNNPLPKQPVVFMKPPTALTKANRPFYYPDFSKDVHHEIEVVLKVCKNGKHIQPKFAHKYFNEVTLGIDFTARDVQSDLKSKGQPWELAKGFDGSAVIGQFMDKSELNFKEGQSFKLTNNETVVQSGNTKDMIFDFDAIISFISQYFMLQTGDLIYTGTPAGVAPVKVGDELTGFFDEKEVFSCRVK